MLKSTKNKLRQVPFLVDLWRIINPQHPKCLYGLDLRQGGSQRLSRRALLSYLVHPFSIPRDDPRFLRHNNIWLAYEIVRILNQLGYIVDVVDYRDTSFVPRKKYDLFIGHGGTNFVKIVRRLPNSTTKIYFSTGCYWEFHNEQELARFAALRERRGVDLPLDRFIHNSEEDALLAADGIIGMGNDFTRSTYANFSPVIMLNNVVLFDDHYEQQEKDFEKGREHFLYFAGGGNVHKGLDLLLEAFVGLEQHLWICSTIDKQFAEVYSDELHNRSNIHLVGWMQLRSNKLYKLMNTCDFVILPSCSEGVAQSVVECMNQGLIPVVNRVCGLDVGGYSIILDPCTIEEIARMVPIISSFSVVRCREMSLKAREAAATNFSEVAFRRNLTDAIQYILSERYQIN